MTDARAKCPSQNKNGKTNTIITYLLPKSQRSKTQFDKKGKEIFDKWGIISTSHMHVNDLKKIFKYIKYKGDYSFTTPEILGLR